MEFLKDWIFWAWEFIASIFFLIGDTIVGTLLEIMPLKNFANSNWIGISFVGFKSIVEAWVPLTEALGVYAVLLTFQLALIVIKWVFKVIPGFGG